MVHKDCMEEDLIPPRLFILFASADKRQYPFPFPSSLCCWKSLRLKQWREAVKLIAFIVMGGLVGRHWNTAQGRRLKVSSYQAAVLTTSGLHQRKLGTTGLAMVLVSCVLCFP